MAMIQLQTQEINLFVDKYLTLLLQIYFSGFVPVNRVTALIYLGTLPNLETLDDFSVRIW